MKELWAVAVLRNSFSSPTWCESRSFTLTMSSLKMEPRLAKKSSIKLRMSLRVICWVRISRSPPTWSLAKSENKARPGEEHVGVLDHRPHSCS